MKASDVFRETDFIFSKKVKFAEAFPQIKNLEIVAIESELAGGPLREGHYSMQNVPGEYIDCSNPLCYNGGFSIGEILREMVKNHKNHEECTRMCQGYEGSPKGRRIYRRCLHKWKITVDIEYAE